MFRWLFQCHILEYRPITIMSLWFRMSFCMLYIYTIRRRIALKYIKLGWNYKFYTTQITKLYLIDQSTTKDQKQNIPKISYVSGKHVQYTSI